jgi:hypothetical protein
VSREPRIDPEIGDAIEVLRRDDETDAQEVVIYVVIGLHLGIVICVWLDPGSHAGRRSAMPLALWRSMLEMATATRVLA